MGSYYQFQRYNNFKYITFDQLTQVANYICRNLNSPSFIFYWFDMYYTLKSFQVIALRKSRGVSGTRVDHDIKFEEIKLNKSDFFIKDITKFQMVLYFILF